jgi:hypothetical protein
MGGFPVSSGAAHRILLASVALALATARPAAADSSLRDLPDIRDPERASYWSFAMLGGRRSPLSDAREFYDPGLAATARLAWTSSLGLGLGIGASYSPLPRRDVSPAGTGEGHIVALTGAPQLTLGRRTLRFWLAGGGGAVIENRLLDGEGGQSDAEIDTQPAGNLASGLELHLFSSGGISLAGDYTRTLGQRRLEFYSLLGGLVFTFR